MQENPEGQSATRIEMLSAGQRDCLRLVGQYHSSKQAARLLGISPHTVDQRLKRAIAILGVASRTDAARMLMRHEAGIAYSANPLRDNHPEMADGAGAALYQHLVYQTPDIPLTAGPVNLAGPRGEDRRGAEAALHDFQEEYFAGKRIGRRRPIWSVLVGDDVENTLGTGTRLMIIAAISVLTVFGFAVLLSIAEGLSRIG